MTDTNNTDGAALLPVREALEQNRGPLAEAARQIAVRFGVGGEGQASAYAAAKDAILASLSTPTAEPMGDALTPSALSGDAGEALARLSEHTNSSETGEER